MSNKLITNPTELRHPSYSLSSIISITGNALGEGLPGKPEYATFIPLVGFAPKKFPEWRNTRKARTSKFNPYWTSQPRKDVYITTCGWIQIPSLTLLVYQLLMNTSLTRAELKCVAELLATFRESLRLSLVLLSLTFPNGTIYSKWQSCATL